MSDIIENAIDAFDEFLEQCFDHWYISLPILVIVVTVIVNALVDPTPKLAEGVLEVTSVDCGITPEESEITTCIIEVKVPETTKMRNVEYLQMLEPGEELDKSEEPES